MGEKKNYLNEKNNYLSEQWAEAASESTRYSILKQLWNDAVAELANEIPAQDYRNHITGIEPIAHKGTTLIVTAPSNDHKKHFDLFYMPVILEKMRNMLPNCTPPLDMECYIDSTGSQTISPSHEIDDHDLKPAPESYNVTLCDEALSEEQYILELYSTITSNYKVDRIEFDIAIRRARKQNISLSMLARICTSNIRRLGKGSIVDPISIIYAKARELAEHEADKRKALPTTPSPTQGESMPIGTAEPGPEDDKGIPPAEQSLVPVILNNHLAKGCSFVDILRYPALILSRQKVVTIKKTISGPNGNITITYSRTSVRGMSPEAASTYEWFLSYAAREGILVDHADGPCYKIFIPSDVFTAFLRCDRKYLMNYIRVFRDSLKFTIWIDTFGKHNCVPDGHGGIVPIPVIETVTEDVATEAGFPEGIKSSTVKGINVLVKQKIVEIMRATPKDKIKIMPETTFYQLYNMDAIPAALARWLSARWHGRQHIDRPIYTTISEIRHELVAERIRKTDRSARRFREHLKSAVEEINETDILGQIGVDHPRYMRVKFEREGEIITIYRTERGIDYPKKIS